MHTDILSIQVTYYPCGCPDHDLQTLSKVCVSLSYINLKGCTSVSDGGIAVVILECVNLHSIVVCETSFGQNSIMALCSCLSGSDRLTYTQTKGSNSMSLAHKLQKLHMGGCMGEFFFFGTTCFSSTV